MIPQRRQYTIRLRGFHRDTAAAVTVNGVPQNADTHYDKSTNTLTAEISAAVTDEICVELTADSLMHDNADWRERCEQLLLLANIFVGDKHKAMEVLRREDIRVHEYVMQLCAQLPSEYVTTLALREMLTLTEDEYENWHM